VAAWLRRIQHTQGIEYRLSGEKRTNDFGAQLLKRHSNWIEVRKANVIDVFARPSRKLALDTDNPGRWTCPTHRRGKVKDDAATCLVLHGNSACLAQSDLGNAS
jgi:hypothetical protein